MKIYLQFSLSFLGCIFVAGSGSAQNWTVNGITQPTQLTTSAIESAVAVDPATGFVSVKTAGGLLAATNATPSPDRPNVAISQASCTNASGQSQSQTTRLMISNNCAANVPLGAGWSVDGAMQPTLLTPSAFESAVAVDPLTGVLAIKTAVAVPLVSISADPSSVSIDGATTVSWAATGFGSNFICTRISSPALSGWSGSSSSASGSISVTMPGTAQTVTLVLNCTADNGTSGNFAYVMVM